jgi:hypothetical protein
MVQGFYQTYKENNFSKCEIVFSLQNPFLAWLSLNRQIWKNLPKKGISFYRIWVGACLPGSSQSSDCELLSWSCRVTEVQHGFCLRKAAASANDSVGSERYSKQRKVSFP